MYATIFATDPRAADERRREAHEPSVGVIVRRTRLTAHRYRQTVSVAHPDTRSVIDYRAQHINHLIGGRFADDLMCPRGERTDDIAVAVLNAGDVERFGTDTFVGESRIGVHHLLDAHLARAQTERDHGV